MQINKDLSAAISVARGLLIGVAAVLKLKFLHPSVPLSLIC